MIILFSVYLLFAGWMSVASMGDMARFIVDVALDSVTGERVTPKSIVDVLSKVSGNEFTINSVSSISNVLAGVSSSNRENFAVCNFQLGFDSPHLVDTQARYGWTPESFEETAARVLVDTSKEVLGPYLTYISIN